MEFALLGFLTGLSLILAIGAQNIFVIEQGLKKQHVFLVCLICSISDFILILLGIFLFHYFTQYFNPTIELLLNILLIIFLIHFIYSKIKSFDTQVTIDQNSNFIEKKNVIFIRNFHLTDFTVKKVSKTPLFYVVSCLVNKKSFHLRDCFHLMGFHLMTLYCNYLFDFPAPAWNF